MDWDKASVVAITGIISVFLALGILNAAVSLSGYLFKMAAKKQAQESKS